MRRGFGLVILMMVSAAEFNRPSPPGKPVWIDCRSPEKETFTCWWQPGSDGGLPTIHRLYYEKDGLNAVLECPDYRSGGGNSCFFNKNHTSLWVEYSLTVVASNDLGNSTSDPLKVDVAKIVKPHPPENITMLVKQNNDIPYLQIRWQKPPKTDIKSGWVTLEYELRVKEENSKEWKKIEPVKETSLDLYSIIPGTAYTVEVRCSVDHGLWSEWSNNTTVKIPNSPLSEKSFMVLVSMLCLIPLLTAIFILIVKRKIVKEWLLPPVPGPKIKGVDVHLLKTGRSEDVTNALISDQNFPLMTTWTDQVEEYLIVSDSDECLLPDPDTSKKKKKCSIIPAGFHLDSETKCEELTSGERDSEKNSKDEMDPLELDGMQQDYSRVKELDAENIVILEKENNPLRTDIQKQEEDVAGDYSRVQEVDSDDTVFLQKRDDSADSCKEKENHNTEWITQQPKKPNVTDQSKGIGTELVCNGYVDSVLNFCIPTNTPPEVDDIADNILYF
ncbi:prolactin receptor b [Xenentodon cancila]